MRMSTTEQQPMMPAQPLAQHAWLRRLVGEWSFEGEALEPGKEPVRSSGTERVRVLGDLWVIAEGQTEMPGLGIGHTLMTLGYDPQKERFIGTWVGSMMTHLWVYEGELEADGQVLPLHTEGPSFEGSGGMARYKDVIELRGENERLLSSYVQMGDGSWHRFMTAHYRRTA
jgi:hypothetical protein